MPASFNNYTDFTRGPVVGPDIAAAAAPASLQFAAPRQSSGTARNSMSQLTNAFLKRPRAPGSTIDAPMRPRGLGASPSQQIALDQSVVGGTS